MSWGNDCYGDRFMCDLDEVRNGSEESRREWFEWRLTQGCYIRKSCDEEFTPTVAAVEEDDDILCPACAAARSGAGTGQGGR